ncbi:MAG: hypothetical protein RIQ59_1591 [Bacteroidota bacterium]
MLHLFLLKVLIMKSLLFILLVSSVCFSQNQVVEIKLVDSSIGGEGMQSGTSNDSGLNQIFQNHNVFRYEYRYNHPLIPAKYYEAECQNCDTNQLYTDLLNYTSVVEKARITSYGSPFLEVLATQLQSATIGIPAGTTNGIITTNDAGLNQIFQNFNVNYYALICTSCTTAPMIKSYYISCNCDNAALKSALDNYTSVINFSEFIHASYWLGNNQFQKSKPLISPNPFSTNFNIQTEDPISTYTLFDITGKKLITTNLKNELDNLSSQLNSGIYFLNLNFENGQNGNFKLLKE